MFQQIMKPRLKVKIGKAKLRQPVEDLRENDRRRALSVLTADPNSDITVRRRGVESHKTLIWHCRREIISTIKTAIKSKLIHLYQVH